MEEYKSWKSDYHKYSGVYNFTEGKDYDSGKIEKIIKEINLVSLYKYRNGNSNDIKNLLNNQLPICTIEVFNDPFEFLYIPDINIDVVRKYSPENLSEIYDEIDKSNKEFTVCSFSQHNDNILMWSHYSNDHKGFCIEYNFEDIFSKNLFPVIYSNNLVVRKNYDISFMLRKSEDWGYESEWRIIDIAKGDGSKIYLINTPIPKAIYLGCRVDNDLKGSLKKYCKDNNVKLYESTINREKYKLEFEEIKF